MCLSSFYFLSSADEDTYITLASGAVTFHDVQDCCLAVLARKDTEADPDNASGGTDDDSDASTSAGADQDPTAAGSDPGPTSTGSGDTLIRAFTRTPKIRRFDGENVVLRTLFSLPRRAPRVLEAVSGRTFSSISLSGFNILATGSASKRETSEGQLSRCQVVHKVASLLYERASLVWKP